MATYLRPDSEKVRVLLSRRILKYLHTLGASCRLLQIKQKINTSDTFDLLILLVLSKHSSSFSSFFPYRILQAVSHTVLPIETLEQFLSFELPELTLHP